SSPFGEIMQSLMFRSDNLMAEGMLRALTPGGTRADAIMEEQAVWSMAGISAHGINIVDGSGLSRDNRLTARFLGDVYTYMATDSFSNDYLILFPKAGFDGTMKNFLVSTPLAGRVAMKTGSMKGVQRYGGYLFDENGFPTHVMVFMANNFRCSRAALKKEIERLLLEKFNVSLQIENPIEADDQENNDEQRLDRTT
ncbi:MAG: D-alanyl-D-alanine carboxypeptidase, partial [Duncaniella sp.]|nr:D-alanyl-D-alanine carboxypeptidase [Duncaniella sp.]